MPDKFARIFHAQLDALSQSVQAARALDAVVQQAGLSLLHCLQRGGKLMLCGNGGSAAHAQHLAAEFVGRFHANRRPLAAMALSVDSSALTCIANDFGYEAVFARQVEALGRAGDCLIALSTSGQSANVLAAVHSAHAQGMQVIGLLGQGGGVIAPHCDVALIVPQGDTARIQELHIVIGHTWCIMVEHGLGLGSGGVTS